MGRSVSVPCDAEIVCFKHFACEEESDSQYEWDSFKEDLVSDLLNAFPSFYECNEWAGREDHVVAKNSLAKFGISEYCGLVSVWLVPNEDSNLSKNWIALISKKFEKLFNEMNLIGRFSNGEAIFEKVG